MNIGQGTGEEQNFGLNFLMKNDEADFEKLFLFDWAAAMADCPQDPLWHAEGDVWTHTRMVYEALVALPEYQSMNRKEQFILQWSAVLHDIAKPLTTEIDENGRIVSPKHAKIGEKLSRQLLWDMNIEVREQICSIVRLHGLPIWSIDREKPAKKLILSSLRVPLKLLYVFAKADMMGRIGSHTDEKMERIEYFRELSIDSNCWEAPFQFENEHSKFRFFLKDEEVPAILYDDTEFEVIAMSGIAGSGKDTYAGKLDLPIISLDEIRKELKISFNDKNGQGKVAQLAYERAKKLCAKKQSFVWNSTNLTEDMRMKLIRNLSVYNPKFRWVYMETSLENIIKSRQDTIKIKNLESMFRILDFPQVYEGHTLEIVRR